MEMNFVQKQKRGQGSGQWPAYVLGEDAHGVWLFCPAGTPYRGWNIHGQFVWSGEVGQGDRDAGMAVVHLVPRAGWWIASWWDDAAGRRISIDICTPPALADDVWHYDDLELDVQAFQDGVVVIDDEAGLVAACEAGEMTAEEARAARAAADALAKLLQQRAEPFGVLGWAKLDAALKSS
jgi:hypothetical protein